jgi:ABC-type multidrug transport system fused ATPase/permease subunit
MKKLFYILTPKERKNSILLLAFFLLMSLLDVIGITAIMPFMAIVSNPTIIEKNKLLQFIYIKLGYKSHRDFLVFVGYFVFTLIIVSVVIRAIGTYMQLRFSLMREYSIAQRLINCYLQQPYSWFLNQNSSNLGMTILSEASQVVNGALMPVMQMASQITISLMLMIILFLADPLIAISILGVLLLIYMTISKITSRKLKQIGEERLVINKERYKVVNEAFGGIKELKIGNFEKVFSKRFQGPAKMYANYQTIYQIIAQLPRFVLDVLVFGSMMLVVIIFMNRKGGIAEMLPVITLYGISAFRLLPALQQIYFSFTTIKFAIPVIESLHQTLNKLETTTNNLKDTNNELKFTKQIELRNINFVYPQSQKKSLSNINFSIPLKSSVAFIGKTGGGKTTLVDLMLGLLKPISGEILVDQVVIDDSNISQWQKKIGYVPQQIYLADDTIASNIAFGVENKNIDFALIYKVAKMANIHDFITNELNDGYMTKVGERGVRLSGGQRQRIGIARALYKRPEVLILDEATSALDNKTESDVIGALSNLSKDLTIITIAHRLSTVKDSDCIYLLDKGEIIDFGKYDDVQKRNIQFMSLDKN